MQGRLSCPCTCVERAAWFLLGLRACFYMTAQPQLQLAASKVPAGAAILRLPPAAFTMEMSSCCRASSFWTTRSIDHLSAGCCSQHPRMTSMTPGGHRSGSVGRHPSATCSTERWFVTFDHGVRNAADCRQQLSLSQQIWPWRLPLAGQS